MIIKWKLWERTFPYICEICGCTQHEMREVCEFCGSKNTLRKVCKKDYKIKKLM